MRIGMVLQTSSGFPPDIRIEKESRALCRAGLDVALLCVRATAEQPEHEVRPTGLAVHRASPHAGALARVARAARWLLCDWPLQPKWLAPIQEFIEAFQPHALHCHDLPLLPTVLHVAAARGLPVVADLHESWPAATEVYRRAYPLLQRLRLRVTSSGRKWRRVERRVLPRCAQIIVVVTETAERLAHDYAIPRERITVVRNTEDEAAFGRGEPIAEILSRHRDRWTAVYVGGVGPHRGVDVAIEAAPLAARQIPRFRLLIVGPRGRRARALAQLVRAAGAEGLVEIVGWVPAQHVPSYIVASRACLVPHRDFEHTQAALPHKLFQYMLLAKPVVVSDCAPLKRVVEHAGAGLVFRADDPADLARCLVELHRDPRAAGQFGQQGRRAACGPYSWRHDAARLLDLYRRLERSWPSAHTQHGARPAEAETK